MLPSNCLSFITNNVKGIYSSKKRLKLMQYFQDKIGSTGVFVLQETHSLELTLEQEDLSLKKRNR